MYAYFRNEVHTSVAAVHIIISLLPLGLNSVTLPLILPLRPDYQGLAEACCRLGLSASKAYLLGTNLTNSKK